jgi:tight adherence protein B
VSMILILAGVFVATLGLVVGGFAVVNRRRLVATEAVRSRLLDSAGAAPSANIAILRQNQRASAVAFLNTLLEGRNFTAVVQAELDKAGVKQNVGTFLLTVAFSGVLFGAFGLRFAGAIGGGVAAGLGVFLPIMVLRVLQTKRHKKFEEQLPEAVDMLVNAMKAGYSLQAAMKFIGDEVTEPLGPEFARFYDEQRLGMDVRTALMNLQNRMDSLDLKMFITALLIQRESGGNLAEIMSNLSSLMRERAAIRGQIDVLTAEPKMSAVVLTLIPIFLFVVVNIINRQYMETLYIEPQGRLLLVYAVVSMLVGYFALQRIGKIDI